MKIDKFVQDVKEKIHIKNDLMQQKNGLITRLNNGRQFFVSATSKQIEPGKLAEATKTVSDLVVQLADIEAKILDTDIILVSMLEAYLADSVARCHASQKLSDAGDNIAPKEFVFVPYKDNENCVEITPEELWFLKIIKQAIGIRNVEIISKDEYYIKEI